jgi:hypothetical protein
MRVRSRSTTTVAAYINLGGLGRYLIDGLAVRDYGRMLGSAVSPSMSAAPRARTGRRLRSAGEGRNAGPVTVCLLRDDDINLGGLGRYLIDGLAVRDYGRMLGSVLLVAVLALLVDALLSLLQRGLTLEMTCRAALRTPPMITGTARGSSTRVRTCHGVMPGARPSAAGARDPGRPADPQRGLRGRGRGLPAGPPRLM